MDIPYDFQKQIQKQSPHHQTSPGLARRQHGLHHAFQLGRAVLQLLGQLRTQRVGHLDLLELPEPRVSSAELRSYGAREGRGGCFRENIWIGQLQETWEIFVVFRFLPWNLGFLQKEKLWKTHPIKESVPVLCLNTSDHGKAQDQLWRKVNDHPKQDPWKGCVVIRSGFGSWLLLLKDCILPAGEFSNCVLTEYYIWYHLVI